MTKIRPNFVDQYGFLTPNLTGPRRIWKLIQAQKDQKEARARRGYLKSLARGDAYRDLLKAEIKEELNPPSTDKRFLTRTAKLMVQTLREDIELHRKGVAARKKGPIYDRGEAWHAVQRIMSRYFEFNEKRFDEDFDLALVEELGDTSVDEELAELEAKLADLKYPASFDGVDHYRRLFTHVVSTWKGKTVTTDVERRVMAERILRDFITDYQSRAGLFDVPVSINGIDISTMPNPHKKWWTELYKLMGLKPTINPKYWAVDSDLSRPDEPPLSLEEMEDVPEPFKEHLTQEQANVSS